MHSLDSKGWFGLVWFGQRGDLIVVMQTEFSLSLFLSSHVYMYIERDIAMDFLSLSLSLFFYIF